MKRLLLDECVDWRLKRYFSPEYEVRAVHEMGWQGVRNSELLQLASQAFDVLITVDKRLPEQHDLSQIRSVSCRNPRTQQPIGDSGSGSSLD
jgi:predicted nuclease of predicted toxin-antitoxin system